MLSIPIQVFKPSASMSIMTISSGKHVSQGLFFTASTSQLKRAYMKGFRAQALLIELSLEGSLTMLLVDITKNLDRHNNLKWALASGSKDVSGAIASYPNEIRIPRYFTNMLPVVVTVTRNLRRTKQSAQRCSCVTTTQFSWKKLSTAVFISLRLSE